MRLGWIRGRTRRRLRALRDWATGGGPHRHTHPSFSPAELIARTDEFNRAAERHWQAIAAEPAGRAHALRKPFANVRDCGPALYRLGLLLTELRAGVGQTVLDFAAGSCWLSSQLNRLGCRTVSVDVSPTALALGQELFRQGPHHDLELEPQFLPYDGHRLPVGDESVDRVVCFDAFHHVPNQDEILREFHRVLRPGGRAVFAEPGEGHSHTGESVFEMERFGVLENDLHLEDVLRLARAAGFGRALVKPYAAADAITLDAREYLQFMAGRDGHFPLDVVRDSLRRFFVFVLLKGEQRIDSRAPGTLRAHITPLARTPVEGTGGDGAEVPVRVRNTGDTLWLHAPDPLGGYVMLGAHLRREGAGASQTRSFVRAALPRDVAPGDQLELTLKVPLPDEPGRYGLKLDLVDEGIAWFEQVGSATVEVPLWVRDWADSRRPRELKARIETTAGERVAARAGARVELPLRASNLGNTRWLRATADMIGTVAVGGHLLRNGEMLAFDLFRSALPQDVAPGESVEVRGVFAAPATPGVYELQIDLVAEGVSWFERRGSALLCLALDVSAGEPDSTGPGRLAGRIRPPNGALRYSAACGSVLSLELEVLNTGDTRWLHAPRAGGGQVALGAHLRDETGALLEQDLLRAPLPGDVAPGEQVRLRCDVPVPKRPGRYQVELDLVDEGIAWFATQGSPTVTLELAAS